MPRFMITRSLPPMSSEQFDAACFESTKVCNGLGITWVRSHITADGRHTFCEYDAPDEETVREHSRRTGIPYDVITPLGVELGPSWA